MNKRLYSANGKGKEIQEFLRKELAIPDSVKWFTVRFGVGEWVTVTCEYVATERTEE